ncbi:hypothetical protein HYU06_02450 [Candidatus Woesearchaeota archaeon]|nr:hypothetical protein [Candidatus Woesearchaeota archaeon]
MVELRKYIVVLVIIVLFAILVQSLIEAIYQEPQYDKFCRYYERIPKAAYPVAYPLQDEKDRIAHKCQDYTKSTEEQIKQCVDSEGQNEYNYDEYGCPTKYECNYCNKNYITSQKKYSLVVFLVSAILGLIAIILGLILPSTKNILHEWVGTGFMLGGIVTLFIGTARYYADMYRILRPIVILIELLIVIYLVYNVFSKNVNAKKPNKKRK